MDDQTKHSILAVGKNIKKGKGYNTAFLFCTFKFGKKAPSGSSDHTTAGRPLLVLLNPTTSLHWVLVDSVTLSVNFLTNFWPDHTQRCWVHCVHRYKNWFRAQVQGGLSCRRTCPPTSHPGFWIKCVFSERTVSCRKWPQSPVSADLFQNSIARARRRSSVLAMSPL